MKWSQNAGQLVASSLLDVGVIALGETPSADLVALGLNKLNGILYELDLYDAPFSAVSAGKAAVAWSSGTPSYVTAPLNYGSDMVLWRTDENGNEIQLTPIMGAEYNALTKASTTAKYPSVFYEDTDKKLYLYPIPTQDPLLKAKYITVIDEVLSATIACPPQWILPLQIGLDYELSLPIGRGDLRTQLLPDWTMRRKQMLANNVESAFPTFMLADGRSHSTNSSSAPNQAFSSYIPLIVGI